MAKKQIIKTDRREGFRLWFEFLKVALRSNDVEIRDAIKKNAIFYDSWDMDKADKFDDWWADHHYLFREKLEVKEIKPGDTPSSETSIVVEIPLISSTSTLTAKVKKIIEAAYERQDKLNKKIRKIKTSQFHITPNSEPKFTAIRHSLNIYRDVYLTNSQLKGMKLLDAAYEYYKNRKSKAWREPPDPIKFNSKHANEDNALRNLNRYIQRGKRITINVASGEFPGKY